MNKKQRVDIYMDPADPSGTLYIFLPEVTTPEEYSFLAREGSRVHELSREVGRLKKPDGGERFGLVLKPVSWPREIAAVMTDDLREICRRRGFEIDQATQKKVEAFMTARYLDYKESYARSISSRPMFF